MKNTTQLNREIQRTSALIGSLTSAPVNRDHWSLK